MQIICKRIEVIKRTSSDYTQSPIILMLFLIRYWLHRGK